MVVHSKDIASRQGSSPFPFDFKYRAFQPAWKATSHRSNRIGNPPEKSAQRGQINTADFYFNFLVKKTWGAKKPRQHGRLQLFFEIGPAGFAGMVFDLLILAKSSESW
jgi:hypothetical protein